MSEPTIDEMLEWLEHSRSLERVPDEIAEAIRAILEQVKQLRENIKTFDPAMQQSLVKAIVGVATHETRNDVLRRAIEEQE